MTNVSERCQNCLVVPRCASQDNARQRGCTCCTVAGWFLVINYFTCSYAGNSIHLGDACDEACKLCSERRDALPWVFSGYERYPSSEEAVRVEVILKMLVSSLRLSSSFSSASGLLLCLSLSLRLSASVLVGGSWLLRCWWHPVVPIFWRSVWRAVPAVCFSQFARAVTGRHVDGWSEAALPLGFSRVRRAKFLAPFLDHNASWRSWVSSSLLAFYFPVMFILIDSSSQWLAMVRTW